MNDKICFDDRTLPAILVLEPPPGSTAVLVQVTIPITGIPSSTEIINGTRTYLQGLHNRGNVSLRLQLASSYSYDNIQTILKAKRDYILTTLKAEERNTNDNSNL